MDLLAKLAHEDDAYDATGLIIVEWSDPESGVTLADDVGEGQGVDVHVDVVYDDIPRALRPERFMATMVSAVLDRTPINFHERARLLRGQHGTENFG